MLSTQVDLELAAVREAIGSDTDVEEFTVDALRVHGATVSRNAHVEVDLDETPQALRDAIGREESFRARFRLPARDGELYLTRTHPILEGLASHVLETALDPLADGVAARCGALRTTAVDRRTTLLVNRYRLHLITAKGGAERPLLAEDAQLLAFTGAPDQADWLDRRATTRLLDARADANIPPDLATRTVERIIDDFDALWPHLEAEAHRRAERLLDAHRRVREAADVRTGARYRVEPQLPPDVLGLYVYLPATG